MNKYYCVQAALLVVVFCFLEFDNRCRVVFGCDNPAHSERDVSGGNCTCGAELPARYVNRTDVIKEEILRKLRMLTPPNATAQLRHLPDIPLLHSLIDQANNENDNRERRQNENDVDDDDDDHVSALTILALSQPGGATLFNE